MADITQADRKLLAGEINSNDIAAYVCSGAYDDDAYCGPALRAIASVRQRLEAAEAEVERCHKRLEIDHVNHLYINPETGEEEMATEVIPMAAPADAIDGIECRDDTIRLLEENRKALIASRDAAHQRHEAAAMQLTFMTEQFEHWHRIAHDRLVSANQLLDRARKAEEALREIATIQGSADKIACLAVIGFAASTAKKALANV
jgi:hypothetical protein